MITRPKLKKNEEAEKFIAAAPDAQPRVAGIPKGNRRQISLTIPPDLLVGLDAMAAETGQTRAGLINMAVFHLLEQRQRQRLETSMFGRQR